MYILYYIRTCTSTIYLCMASTLCTVTRTFIYITGGRPGLLLYMYIHACMVHACTCDKSTYIYIHMYTSYMYIQVNVNTGECIYMYMRTYSIVGEYIYAPAFGIITHVHVQYVYSLVM